MVSKNNQKLNNQHHANQTKQRWALRKYSVGVASVLLGTTLFVGSATVAHADTTTSPDTKETADQQLSTQDQQQVVLQSQPTPEKGPVQSGAQQPVTGASQSQDSDQQQAVAPKSQSASSQSQSVDDQDSQAVTYHFVDSDGNQVGTYTAPTGKSGATVKINQYKFNRALPKNYYFADPNYQVPTTYTYTNEVNPTVTVNVKQIDTYTLWFYDDTTNQEFTKVSWDGSSAYNHQLAAVLDDLNKWIQEQARAIQYHGYNLTDPDLNLSQYPVSADITTPLPVLTALPDQDTSVTIHFNHHFYDVDGQIPLWQAPNVQLTPEGMQVLLNAFNGTHGDGTSNIMNYGMASFASSAYFKSLLPQIFKGAQWTSGGLVIGSTDPSKQTSDDPYDGSGSWDLFSTAGSGGNLQSPVYQRPMTDLAEGQYDQFYLTAAGWQKIAHELGLDPNNGLFLSEIVGTLPMLKYHGQIDGFNVESDGTAPNGSRIFINETGLTIKSTNADEQIPGKTIPAGYDIQVFVPIYNQKDGTVKYQLVTVKSHDLQKKTTINDIANLYANYSDSSLNDRIAQSGAYATLQHNPNGTYSWRLTNTGTGYNSFYSLEHDYSDPNDALAFLKKVYSPIYYEAITEALKEAGVAVNGANLSQIDWATPLTMFYVLTPHTESATITYVDDATGKVLKTETTTGNFDSLIQFANNPTAVIQSYLAQGYTLVSNDFQNQKFQEGENSFTVHLSSVSDQNDTNNASHTSKETNSSGYHIPGSTVSGPTFKLHNNPGNQTLGNGSTSSNWQPAQKLPQTGNEEGQITLLGVLLSGLGLSMAGGFFSKKKHNQG